MTTQTLPDMNTNPTPMPMPMATTGVDGLREGREGRTGSAAENKATMDGINAQLFASITHERLAQMCHQKARVDEAVRRARAELYKLANEPEIVKLLATGHPSGSIGAVEAVKARLGVEMPQADAGTEAETDASSLLATCTRLLLALHDLKGKIGHPHAHEALVGFIVFGFDHPLGREALAAAASKAMATTREIKIDGHCTVTVLNTPRLHRGAPAPNAVPAPDARPGAIDHTSPISADAATTRRDYEAMELALNTGGMLGLLADSMDSIESAGTTALTGAVTGLPLAERDAIGRVWACVAALVRNRHPEDRTNLMRALPIIHAPEKARTGIWLYHIVLSFSLELWDQLARAPQLHDGDTQLLLTNLQRSVDLMREGTVPGEFDYVRLMEMPAADHDQLEAAPEAPAPKRQCRGGLGGLGEGVVRGGVSPTR